MAKPRLTCSCGHSWLALPDESDRFCPRCGEPIRAETVGQPSDLGRGVDGIAGIATAARAWTKTNGRCRRAACAGRPSRPSRPPRAASRSRFSWASSWPWCSRALRARFFFVRMAARNARAARIASVPTTVVPANGVAHFQDCVKRRGIPEGVGFISDPRRSGERFLSAAHVS